jgi:hypothetical protein
MKVKTIKHIEFLNFILPKDSELTVNPFKGFGIEFYQIKEGSYKGYVLNANDCKPINDEKLYTENEMKAIEAVHLAKLDKEMAAKNRAIEMVASLGKQIVKKNAEIEKLEFYISALSIGLSASGEAIAILRETAKQNG